jgi:uncharacterized protein
MRRLFFICLFSLFGCFGKQSDSQGDKFNIPQPIGLVNDYEKSFTTEEEKRIDSLLQSINARGKVQIAFATFDSSYAPDSLFAKYSLQVARQWGIGDKNKNNGIFLCLSLTMRNVQIRTGLGIEDLVTDSLVARVIDSTIIPAFKKREFAQGVYSGIEMLGRISEDRIR